MPRSIAMKRAAEISECGKYRWTLTRDWSDGEPLFPHGNASNCLFVGLNPSKADALIDDQTVRIWISFARIWGYTGFTVMNLTPHRATDPHELLDADIPFEIRDENFRRLYKASKAFGASDTIVCWGSHKWIRETGTDREVLESYIEGRPQCLGVTKDGYPRHPLRLPLATQLVPYRLPVTAS